MSAHDTTGRQSAHHSPLPSVKPKMMNIDETGVSMSWKTAAGIIVVVAMGVASALAFVATLAQKDDVEAKVASHDESPHAHMIEVQNPYTKQSEIKPLPKVVSDVYNDVAAVKKQARETQQDVRGIQETVDVDQAERLADRAADKEHRLERKLQTWREVKAKALRNKREGKPVRDGLEERVF